MRPEMLPVTPASAVAPTMPDNTQTTAAMRPSLQTNMRPSRSGRLASRPLYALRGTLMPIGFGTLPKTFWHFAIFARRALFEWQQARRALVLRLFSIHSPRVAIPFRYLTPKIDDLLFQR